jgi:hypothetical protein
LKEGLELGDEHASFVSTLGFIQESSLNWFHNAEKSRHNLD